VAGTLTWHEWISSIDLPRHDYAYLRVNGADLDSHTLSSFNSTGGWVERSIPLNLVPYAGSTIDLRFVATTDGTQNSNWFIDDITLDATLVPVPTAAWLAMAGLGAVARCRKRLLGV